MNEIIYVNTGEVTSGGTDVILNSGAIGSCVVITGYCPIKHVGAMAHVMLPGKAPIKNRLNVTKYAGNAIDELFNQLLLLDCKKENIEFCLAGGANVLKRDNDSIGKDNIASIKNLFDEKGIIVNSESLGGFERRNVLFEIEKGSVYVSVGGSKQEILWQTMNRR